MECKYLSRIMEEPVRMPGYPQLVVKRGWLYQYLLACGWDASAKGFDSLEYIVFGRDVATEKRQEALTLTDEAERDRCLYNPHVREIYLKGDHQ